MPDAAGAMPCPCGSGAVLSRCCAPLIDGSHTAADALALMRSRYTAYTQLREDYLLATGIRRPGRPRSICTTGRRRNGWT